MHLITEDPMLTVTTTIQSIDSVDVVEQVGLIHRIIDWFLSLF